MFFIYWEDNILRRQTQEWTSLLCPTDNKEIRQPLPSQLDMLYHLYSFTNDCIAGISAESD